MLRFLSPFGLVLTGLALTLAPSRASAGDILFVSDVLSDTNIPTVLTGEGHVVTTVLSDYSAGDNPTLRGSLSGYDAVFWSATGGGSGSTHTNAAVFTNLTSYVTGGGRVFVTGYDSIASPADPSLITFLGGTSSSDGGVTGIINPVDNSLTNGEVDIRGVTPTGHYGDRDTLIGLGSDTVAVMGAATGASWTLRTLGGGEIAYVSNGQSGTSAHASWVDTTAGGAGAYNAALRNFAAVVLGGAPIIRFMGDTMADEGTDVTLTVMIEDREMDPVTWSWDLDGDGTFGDLPGVDMYTIAGTDTDGPEDIRIGVQASDGTESRDRYITVSIANVDPEITSTPPAGPAFIGGEWRYELVWTDPAGARDLPIFTLPGAPAGMVVSRGGIITWTPTSASRDMGFPIVVTVDDADGGVASQMFDLLVSANRPPTDPMPLSPIMREAITNAMPTLVIRNGTDPDGDRLSYFFRIDSVSSYDSAFLIESPEVVEMMDGTTSWGVPTNLTPGIWYWQVKGTDGIAETGWVNAVFNLQEPGGDAGPPPDSGPRVDSGTIAPPPTTGRRGDSGCGCRVAGQDSTPPAAGFAVALLVALFLGRRRRR